MDADPARLRAFVQVAERGTVAAAAEALGYTGPAVSQQVSRLELSLGEELFDRVGGRLRLSARGQQLLPLAVGVLDAVDRFANAASEPAGDQPVTIGGFASALRAIALPALGATLATKETSTVDLQELEDEEALRELRLGAIDIALIQHYEGIGPAASFGPRLHATTLARDRLRLIAPSRFPRDVRLEELAALGWLVNGTGTRCEEAVERILASRGIEPRICGRIADNETLLDAVAAGLGATIAPELVLATSLSEVTVATENLGATRTISAVTRRPPSQAVRAVVASLRSSGRDALRRAREPSARD